MKLKFILFQGTLLMILIFHLVSSIQLESRLRILKKEWGQIHSRKVILNESCVGNLDTLYTDVVGKVLPCVVEMSTTKNRSKGAGFVFNKEKGYILTAEHVVKALKGKGHITKDGRKIRILDTYVDPVNDFGVVIADVNDFDYYFYSELELEDTDNIRVGTPVLAFGHPHRQRYSVSLGIVSALNRRWSGHPKGRFLQTDAAINPGNSGGPLVNLQGKVVGIVVGIYYNKAPQNTGVSIAVNTESMQESLRGFEKWLERKKKTKRSRKVMLVESIMPLCWDRIEKIFGRRSQNEM